MKGGFEGGYVTFCVHCNVGDVDVFIYILASYCSFSHKNDFLNLPINKAPRIASNQEIFSKVISDVTFAHPTESVWMNQCLRLST